MSRAELTLTADTLRADPRGDIGEGRQDRWHTFFVRAIDNEGAKDPTPARRTFNAYTLGPRMARPHGLVIGVKTVGEVFVEQRVTRYEA